MNPLPPKHEVDKLLASLEREHPRRIAKRLIAEHRTQGLTQQMIDGDGKGDSTRWDRQISNAVRFKRRGVLARLLHW